MEYFRINYNKLQNLSQKKYYIVIIIVFLSLLLLISISCVIDTYEKFSVYGVYNNNILKIKINNKLSDTLKNNQYIKFNEQKTTYKILSFGEYEIIDNEIYQEVNLAIDDNFINNEVGLVELYYDKKKIIKYILELFK